MATLAELWEAEAPAPVKSAKVPSQDQAMRDKTRMDILQSEMTKAQQRFAQGDARAQRDNEALTREMGQSLNVSLRSSIALGKSLLRFGHLRLKNTHSALVTHCLILRWNFCAFNWRRGFRFPQFSKCCHYLIIPICRAKRILRVNSACSAADMEAFNLATSWAVISWKMRGSAI